MKPLLLTFNLLCGMDAATTHRIIATGGVEQFYPVQNPVAVDALIAGQCTSSTLGLSKLEPQHPKAARIVAWTLIGVRGFVVAHNLRALASR